MPLTHLLYLHGFRSSPRSMKARKVAARVQRDHPDLTWLAPALPPSPAGAMAGVLAATAHWPAATSAVIGSSLGGFYARWVAARRGWRAVLLNPAAHPARDLARHIGEQTAWHDPAERFFFEPRFVDELRAMEADLTGAPRPKPDRLLAVVATGDEVLDWREMNAFAAGGTLRQVQGSDHALSDFDDHIDAVFGFLRG